MKKYLLLSSFLFIFIGCTAVDNSLRRIAEENRNSTRHDGIIGMVLKEVYSASKPLKDKPLLQKKRKLAISYLKKAKSYKNQKEYMIALEYLKKAMRIEEKIYREIYPYEAKKK